jgi:V/A-type H+-transporting ATPase subunit F
MEIAVIGDHEFVLGFRLAGVRKTYTAETEEKLTATITRALDDGTIGILVLQSRDMNRIPRRLQATLENSVKPTVIAVGGEAGGMTMRERIKRSVGVDLWK